MCQHKARLSARKIRDAGDFLEYEEVHTQPTVTPRKRSGGALVLAGLGVVLCGFLLLSGEGGGGRRDRPQADYRMPTVSLQSITDSVREFVAPGSFSLTAQTSFSASTGLGEWLGDAKGWKIEGDSLRPSALRLWKPSQTLADYRFEFEGAVAKGGLGWAFRAPDERNYYSTQLVLTAKGEGNSARLVRTVVLAGKEVERTSLPIPVTLNTNERFKIQLVADGSDFVTAVNGRRVDIWQDHRLPRGGVGLFANNDSLAQVSSVALYNRIASSPAKQLRPAAGLVLLSGLPH